MASRFLSKDGPYRSHLIRWGSCHDENLHTLAFDELLAYATGLVVMQRLEGRHSILKRVLAFKHFQTPASVSATMRRYQNGDLESDVFQRNLADFLSRIGELQLGTWGSKTELLETYSKANKASHDPLYELRALKEQFNQQLSNVCSEGDTGPDELPLLREHVKLALGKGHVYTLKGCFEKGVWAVFRVLHQSPSNNMYLQKACHISFDAAVLKGYLVFALST